VRVTVERGDPNWQDAKRIFDETKALVQIFYRVDPPATFRKATKQECPNLMIADFMAYTSYMMRTTQPDQNTLSEEDAAALGLPVSASDAEKGKPIWISFDSDQLKKLTAHLADLHRTRHEAEHMG
jgi:hypothetical protein